MKIYFLTYEVYEGEIRDARFKHCVIANNEIEAKNLVKERQKIILFDNCHVSKLEIDEWINNCNTIIIGDFCGAKKEPFILISEFVEAV